MRVPVSRQHGPHVGDEPAIIILPVFARFGQSNRLHLNEFLGEYCIRSRHDFEKLARMCNVIKAEANQRPLDIYVEIFTQIYFGQGKFIPNWLNWHNRLL